MPWLWVVAPRVLNGATTLTGACPMIAIPALVSPQQGDGGLASVRQPELVTTSSAQDRRSHAGATLGCGGRMGWAPC